MKKRLYDLCLPLLFLLCSFVFRQIDKEAFYKALSSGSEQVIDQELEKLSGGGTSSLGEAYQGALLMKKAGFVKGVKGKVKIFKEGAKKLEQQIEKHPANTEYCFLRLTIQEHAPGILNYNKEISADKAAVVEGFSKMDAVLKTVVRNYTKDSKVLKERDLK